MKGRGFTVVELIIVIVIISVLAVIGSVSFTRMQVEARNSQRITKVENIARYLEGIYTHGNIAPMVEPGTYPRASAIADSCNAACTGASSANPWPTNTARLESLFGRDGFDTENLKVPGSDNYSIVVARNANTVPAPAPTLQTFVYQPLAISPSGGYTLCNVLASECRAFNLFYMLENDSTVHKITSKHR